MLCACIALRPEEGVQGHPGPSDETVSGKKMILLLKYARKTDLRPKKLVVCSINNNICVAKLAKRANYASSAFFAKMKIMHVKTDTKVMLAQSIIKSHMFCYRLQCSLHGTN